MTDGFELVPMTCIMCAEEESSSTCDWSKEEEESIKGWITKEQVCTTNV